MSRPRGWIPTRRIKDLILEVRSEGAPTVFVTTHDMMVADELCDRVAFITAGQIRLIDAPSVLKNSLRKCTVRVEYFDGKPTVEQREFSLDRLADNAEFINLLKSAERIETIHTQETTLEECSSRSQARN